MGSVRIIAGIYRSRIIKFPNEVEGLRPTSNRVREVLFNWLLQDLSGKTCLDLFGGSGALGFEAASRNAIRVDIIEKNYKVYQALLHNKKLLKIDTVNIIRADALSFLGKAEDGNRYDIWFLDPPYDSNLLNECLGLMLAKNLVMPRQLIYIEYQNEPDLTKFEIIKQGNAGVVCYALIKVIR
ncbi:MAG: 16S rRNA (guanine(966)-N(2))-methyltransferase RsmD [Bacteroidia bacterium]|nr:MAG: 16S rRNA (guanine(966)-N(2))-methyltransferase RsmD [Bacteroidia bacterium]